MSVPVELRDRVAADYAPVRPLAPPLARALWCVPFALLAFGAAPAFYSIRQDAAALGWLAWTASIAQAAAGFVVIAAALRESVPGRSWRGASIVLLFVAPAAIAIGLTLASWQASPISIRGNWWFIFAVCLASSAATALPVVALSAVLAARAYPMRPAVTGALAGLGAGLIADAGWRMFCHFSEPAHVLSAHLGGIALSVMAGVVLSIRLTPHTTPRRHQLRNTRSTNQ
jgi:hypothetical protein